MTRLLRILAAPIGVFLLVGGYYWWVSVDVVGWKEGLTALGFVSVGVMFVRYSVKGYVFNKANQ